VNPIRRLAAERRWTGPAAGVLGFLEGTFVVFPMEPLFIPMMAVRRAGAWWVAAWLLAGNVLGGLVMYALGAWLLDPVVRPLVSLLGLSAEYAEPSARLKEQGFEALVIIGVTPFPYQLGTAAAGAVGVGVLLFLAAVTLARGARYFALAALVAALGARSQSFLVKREKEILIAGIVLFVVLAGLTIIAG